MVDRDLIVIGGSAGALEPLAGILNDLPSGLPAAVLVILHTSAGSGSALPEILARNTVLPVSYAVDNEPLLRGRVYVAPPDRHLLVKSGTLSIIQGPRENGFRPAIDPLFRSAAEIYDSRVTGVILSGALDDGTFGLAAVKDAGGLAIVQHPYEATIPSMPLSAIQNVEVDHIVRSKEIAQILIEGVRTTNDEPTSPLPPISGALAAEKDRDITLAGAPPDQLVHQQGLPSIYSCPECGGTLWEVEERGQFRFRCHTGHGFTPDTLLAEQNGRLEYALWSAIRVLQERAALHRQLADRCAVRGQAMVAQKYQERADAELGQSNLLREFFDRTNTRADTPLPQTP